MRDTIAGLALGVAVYMVLAVLFVYAAYADQSPREGDATPHVSRPEPMPPVVVLIVCKTVLIGTDQNSQYTGWENREWAYQNSMMLCRRQEIPMFDISEAQGADPIPFNPTACMAASVRLAAQWDVEHKDYKTWRTACPVPIKNDVTGDGPTPDDPIVGWSLPSCGHEDTVICEVDSQI